MPEGVIGLGVIDLDEEAVLVHLLDRFRLFVVLLPREYTSRDAEAPKVDLD